MTDKTTDTLLHGTVVDIAGCGVMLRGPSGSGKSDLALRLIDRGATLITDDQIYVLPKDKGLRAKAPAAIRGYLEIRGLGLISTPVTGSSFIRLIVDLVPPEEVPRLPVFETEVLLGKKIPRLKLNAFEVSAPLKIELAASDTSRIGNVGRIGNTGPEA